MLGPTLGALAGVAFGGPVALLIDAGSFLACGALVVDLYVYVEERAGASVRARLAAAWEHVRDAPALRAMLLTQATALVFFETAAPVEVFYAKGPCTPAMSATARCWQSGGSASSAGASSSRVRAPLAGGDADARHARGRPRLSRFRRGAHAGVAALAALLGGVGNGVQWASLLGTVQLLTPGGCTGA